jgi:Mce-associated membrane protein
MRATRIPVIRPLRRGRSERARKAESDRFDDEETAVLVDQIPDQIGELPLAAKRRHRYIRKPSTALTASVAILIVVAGLTSWLAYQTYEARQTQQQRALFLQVGRQGALNLTTISAAEAGADMKRILDSSTGASYDQVQQGSQEFVAVLQQAQTKSEGTIAEAGVESEQGDQAQVLVAVNVKPAVTGGSDQPTRTWRMRLTVQQVDGGAKISNVEFVP